MIKTPEQSAMIARSDALQVSGRKGKFGLLIEGRYIEIDRPSVWIESKQSPPTVEGSKSAYDLTAKLTPERILPADVVTVHVEGLANNRPIRVSFSAEWRFLCGQIYDVAMDKMT